MKPISAIFWTQLGVEAPVAVVVARAGDDLAVGEVARGLADQPLLVGQLEVDHVPGILHHRPAGSRTPARSTLADVDEFTAFVLGGMLVLGAVFYALGRWYPGSGAEQVDWRPTRSYEDEVRLELEDVDQMIEAQNERRRASGRPEISEDQIRAQVAAEERWRERGGAALPGRGADGGAGADRRLRLPRPRARGDR